MTTRVIRPYLPFAVAGAGACLLSVAACSGSSPASPSGSVAPAAAAPAASSGQAVDACTLVTAADLSQAVGVQYASITAAGGGLCNVKGPGPAAFDYTIERESATNTWSEQVATIKGDDGQALSEPGIGDQAVWGGEEFAAEADGYIVGIVDADFPSTAQGSGFVRTGKIAKLLISKL